MIWKKALGAFFVLVLIEGALRKWVLPGYSQVLYILKDFVLAAALVIYLIHAPSNHMAALRRFWLYPVLMLYLWWAAFEAFNPREPSLGLGLFGLKCYVLYTSLLLLVPAWYITSDTDSLERLFRRYVWFFALPIMALGIYQFTQPPGHWVNAYTLDAEVPIATYGTAGYARVTGTFPYIAGMTMFVTFSMFIGLGIVLSGAGDKLTRGTAFVLVLGAISLAPLTGSRSALFLPVLALPFLVWIASRRSPSRRRLKMLLPILVGCALIATGSKLSHGWQGFSERAQGAKDTRARIDDTLLGPVSRMQVGGLLGYGAGTTHQAAPVLVSNQIPYSWLPTRDFEEENGRVAIELGMIGFWLYVLVKIGMCHLAYRVAVAARSSWEMAIGMAGFGFLFVCLPGGIVFNATGGAIYWGLAGLLVAFSAQQQYAGRIRWALNKPSYGRAAIER